MEALLLGPGVLGGSNLCTEAFLTTIPTQSIAANIEESQSVQSSKRNFSILLPHPI